MGERGRTKKLHRDPGDLSLCANRRRNSGRELGAGGFIGTLQSPTTSFFALLRNRPYERPKLPRPTTANFTAEQMAEIKAFLSEAKRWYWQTDPEAAREEIENAWEALGL